MSKLILQSSTWALAAFVLAGCAVTAPNGQRAPVMEYSANNRSGNSAPQAAAPRPVPVMVSEYKTVTREYTVRKGDTLYSIAFFHGVDYRDVADWNHLDNPAAIKIGQQLKLHIPVAGSAPRDLPRPVMASQVPDTTSTRSYPRVGKLAYTDNALAQAERLQHEPGNSTPATPAVVAAAPEKSTRVEKSLFY